MRFLFYFSIVSLIVLVLWEHSAARGWQELADNAQKAQDTATKMAKGAFDKADRCVGEISKEQAAPAAKAPTAKAPAGKPANPPTPRRPGSS